MKVLFLFLKKGGDCKVYDQVKSPAAFLFKREAKATHEPVD